MNFDTLDAKLFEHDIEKCLCKFQHFYRRSLSRVHTGSDSISQKPLQWTLSSSVAGAEGF